MAQIPYRANLSASTFPMTLAKAGRSVIIPQTDQSFDRRVDAPGEDLKGSVGIPQILWAQDVLPTPDGFQSVGYDARGTITIPSSQLINGIISTRLPLQNSTAFGISFTDRGDNIGTWTLSPAITTPPTYSEVVESATVGNPLPSYEMREDETRDPGEEPYMYKEFVGLDISANIEFSTEFMFSSADNTQNRRCNIGVACQESGAGIHIAYLGSTNLLAVGSSSSWEFFTFGAVTSVAAPTVSFDAWYKITTTITINPDTSKDVTATLYDTDGTTVLATVTANSFPVTNGNFCGLNYAETTHDSPGTYASMFWDNIEIAADGIGFESEVASAVITFFSNNTVNWSHSEVNYENLVANVPVGFESPVNQDNLSFAYVRGQAYICIRKDADSTTRIYRVAIDEATVELDFTEVTADINDSLPSPYSVNDVICIVGSFNYLILLTKATCFWSSTTTPTDFLPSLVSGAGFGYPNNLKANVSFAKEHSSGFFIYTPKNVVFAAYTGNARYPWKFREVTGSGGYALQTQASGDTNTALQVGVTVTGQLQSLNPDAAILVAPEVSDFFERVKAYDLFDSATNTFSLVQNLMRGPNTEFQIFFVLDRYILCPYGRSGTTPYKYEYILVFDTQLRRYGKLKRACNFIYTDEENIFFLDRVTGVITSLNTNILTVDGSGDPTHAGVLLLGKFQFVRDRFIQMEQIELESSAPTSIVPVVDRIFTARLIPSFDGKNLSTSVALTPNTARSVGTLMSFDSHTTAKNFCLLVRGAFDLCHLGMIINPHGRF